MTDATTWHRGTWITAKHAGTCSTCRRATFRGETVRYYPQGRRLQCSDCGRKAAQPVANPVPHAP